MPLSDLKRHVEKYYENNNIARFTILLDCMTKEEKQEWLKRAQTDRKTNFVAVLSNVSRASHSLLVLQVN